MNCETTILRVVQTSVSTFFILSATACSMSIPNAAPGTAEEHDFSIELYELGAVDLTIVEDNTQPGILASSGVEPVDVLRDDELVGVDWENRFLEYGPDVRARYGDADSVIIPPMHFVVKWDGHPVFGGWLVNAFSAMSLDIPVLKHNLTQTCEDQRVVLRLLPNSWGDISSEYPGLTGELESDWREYFNARPPTCIYSR